MRQRSTVGTALFASLLVGCAANPLTRRFQVVALSERQELIAGREVLGALRESNRFLDDGPALELVASTGQELALFAPGAPFPYTFHVLDVPEPNAFALPGGVVVVTRGLLAVLRTRDELAGVLGHEIGHVAARHAAARLAWSLPANAITQLLKTTAAVINPSWGQRLGDEVTRSLWTPYTHHQEREADRLGIAIAASAGFAPGALGALLERLERLERVSGPREQAMKASHPSPALRAQLIATLAAQLAVGEPAAEGTSALAQALDGLVVGQDPSVGALVDGELFFPSAGVALSMPAGWIGQAQGLDFFAVAPAGRAVIKARIESPAQARLERAQLADEPGFEDRGVGTTSFVGVQRATVLYDARGRETRWLWLQRGQLVVRLAFDLSVSDAATGHDVDAVVASARPLSSEELARVEVVRLRTADCADAASWDACATQHDSAWSGAELAARNDADPTAPPPAAPLRLARREAMK